MGEDEKIVKFNDIEIDKKALIGKMASLPDPVLFEYTDGLMNYINLQHSFRDILNSSRDPSRCMNLLEKMDADDLSDSNNLKHVERIIDFLNRKDILSKIDQLALLTSNWDMPLDNSKSEKLLDSIPKEDLSKLEKVAFILRDYSDHLRNFSQLLLHRTLNVSPESFLATISEFELDSLLEISEEIFSKEGSVILSKELKI